MSPRSYLGGLGLGLAGHWMASCLIVSISNARFKDSVINYLRWSLFELRYLLLAIILFFAISAASNLPDSLSVIEFLVTTNFVAASRLWLRNFLIFSTISLLSYGIFSWLEISILNSKSGYYDSNSEMVLLCGLEANTFERIPTGIALTILLSGN